MRRTSKGKWIARCLAILLVIVLVGNYVPSVGYALDSLPKTTKIDHFEHDNPVYWIYVDPGTDLEDAALPTTLRAVFALDTFDLDPEEFVQAEPEEDLSDGYSYYDYFWYGYVAPRKVYELYEADELAVYSVYIEDPDNPGKVGEIGSRVYGSIGDSGDTWFTCEEDGTLTGVIYDVPVTWSGDYDADTEGIYVMKASAEGFSYKGDAPFAEIIVKEDDDDGEEIVIDDEDEEETTEEETEEETTEEAETEEETEEETTAEAETEEETTEEETEKETGEDEDSVGILARFWNSLTDGDRESGEDDSEGILVRFWKTLTGQDADEEELEEMAEGYDETTAEGGENGENNGSEEGEDGEEEGEEDENEIQPLVSSEFESGGNESAMTTLMTQSVVTLGGASTEPEDYAKQSSTWETYVNTIWWNKAYNNSYGTGFDWTPHSQTESTFEAWNGDFALAQTEQSGWQQVSIYGIYEYTGNGAESNAKNYSTGNRYKCGKWRTGNSGSWTWEVYSAEQLCYALQNYAREDTVKLESNIDLNGYTYSWDGIDLYRDSGGYALTLDGNGYTIYNFGQLNGTTEGTTNRKYTNKEGTSYYVKGGGFFINDQAFLTIKDLTFETAKVIENGTDGEYLPYGKSATSNFYSYTGIIGAGYDYSSSNTDYDAGQHYGQESTSSLRNQGGLYYGFTKTFENVDVNDSMVAVVNLEDCYVSPFMSWSDNVCVTAQAHDDRYYSSSDYTPPRTERPSENKENQDYHSVTECSVYSSYVYGQNHVNGFSAGASDSVVSNCYSAGNLVCGTGKHSAGFVSCNVVYSDFTNCFASNEFYGTTDVAGFVALSAECSFNQCFSSGKVEGFSYVGGFVVSVGNRQEFGQSEITDCYSTALVCLRSGETTTTEEGRFTTTTLYNSCHDLAGFYAQSRYKKADDALSPATAYQITNCYAAGEVGNYDTDIENPGNFDEPQADDDNDSSGNGFANCGVYGTIGGFISRYSNLQTKYSPYTTKGTQNQSQSSAPTGTSGLSGSGNVGVENPNTSSTCSALLNVDSFQYCYYDKQTTAMRGWVAGDINTEDYAGTNVSNSDGESWLGSSTTTGSLTSYGDITGLLTTYSSKAGSGLTGGKDSSGNDIAVLPSGFSSNIWTAKLNYYPELSAFASATPEVWGSEEKANRVKAYSLASTSTVLLDTWDSGYDWDEWGVRTVKDDTEYNRTKTDIKDSTHDNSYDGYKGYVYTYDTVRDIISDFTVTGDGNVYSYMIDHNYTDETSGSGAYTSIVQADSKITGANWHNKGKNNGEEESQARGQDIQINNPEDESDREKTPTYTATVAEPGMEWYSIVRTVEGVYGYRPIRLISAAHIDAGDDAVLQSGDTYDHRDDVKLTQMYQLSSNLITRFNNADDWATSVTGGYPNNAAFYGVKSDYMIDTDRRSGETTSGYAASIISSLPGEVYTEIWEAVPYDTSTEGHRDTSDIEYASEDTATVYGEKDADNPNKEKTWREWESVEVTGDTAEVSQEEEDTWNGEIPFKVTADGSASSTYIVSYYWLMYDGRYVTDYKIISLEEAHNVRIEVRDYYDDETGGMDNALNSTSLDIGAGIAEYEVSSEKGNSDLQYSMKTGVAVDEKGTVKMTPGVIDSGTNVQFGWARASGADKASVKKIQIEFFDTVDGTSLGKKVIGYSGIKNATGDEASTYPEDTSSANGQLIVSEQSDLLDMGKQEFTITISDFETTVYEKYAGDGYGDDEHKDEETGEYRETLQDIQVDLTYTITYDETEGYSLILNKWCAYSDADYDDKHNTTDGIGRFYYKDSNGNYVPLNASGDFDEKGDLLDGASVPTIDDLFSDVVVTLWVTEPDSLVFGKADGASIQPETDGAVTSYIGLDGAQFVLQDSESKYYKLEDDGTVSWVDDSSDATVLTSGNQGLVSVYGLETGTYTLTETKAPDGYELPSNPSWTLEVTDTSNNIYQYTISGGPSPDADGNSYTARATAGRENQFLFDYVDADGNTVTMVVTPTLNTNGFYTFTYTGASGQSQTVTLTEEYTLTINDVTYTGTVTQSGNTSTFTGTSENGGSVSYTVTYSNGSFTYSTGGGPNSQTYTLVSTGNYTYTLDGVTVSVQFLPTAVYYLPNYYTEIEEIPSLRLTKINGDTVVTDSNGDVVTFNPLSGATFILSQYVDAEGENVTKDADGATKQYYTYEGESVVWVTSEDGADKLVTGDDGVLEIVGLTDGTYYLEEITSPDGYGILVAGWTIVVSTDADGAYSFTVTGTTKTVDSLGNYITYTEDGGKTMRNVSVDMSGMSFTDSKGDTVTLNTAYTCTVGDVEYVGYVTSSSGPGGSTNYTYVYTTSGDWANSNTVNVTESDGSYMATINGTQVTLKEAEDTYVYTYDGSTYTTGIMTGTSYYIPNYLPYELPSTAGDSILRFIIAGAVVMMLAAGFLLWIRRRRAVWR